MKTSPNSMINLQYVIGANRGNDATKEEILELEKFLSEKDYYTKNKKITPNSLTLIVFNLHHAMEIATFLSEKDWTC